MSSMENVVEYEEPVMNGVEATEKPDGGQDTSPRKRPLQRLYFVRYAKPADPSIDGLEKAKDSLDSKLRQIAGTLAPLMENRSQLSNTLAESREVAADLKAKIEDNDLFLAPKLAEKRQANEEKNAQRLAKQEMRANEKKEREERIRAEQNARQKRRNDFNSAYGHLGVLSDEEIDAKIAELEFSQQHDSLPISQEKLLIEKIRQLKASREAVREHAEWLAQEKLDRDFRTAESKKRKAEPNQSQAPMMVNGGETGPLDETEEKNSAFMQSKKQESDELWDRYKAELDKKKALQEQEKTLKADIEKLVEERDGLRKQREEVWEKIQKQRADSRAASKPYTQNRALSSKIRDLIKQGQIAEAQKLCSEQVEETMGQYQSDIAFRKEYNALWDAQVDYKRPLDMYQSDSFQSTAASVIAEALEAAKRKIAQKSSTKENAPAANGAASAEPKKTSEPKAQPPVSKVKQPADDSEASTETLVPPKPAIIPGLEAEPRSKPKKAKKTKTALVELPVIDQAEFVPPEAIRKSDVVELSAAEKKEAEKERNRLLQVEAAQRKERRRQAQEKKKAQKIQRAELQQQKQESADELLAESAGEGNATPVESSQTPIDSSETNGSVITNGEAKSKTRPSSKTNKQLAKVIATPKLRPVPRTKKGLSSSLRQYARGVYNLAEENPLAVGGGAIALIAVVFVAPVLYLAY